MRLTTGGGEFFSSENMLFCLCYGDIWKPWSELVFSQCKVLYTGISPGEFTVEAKLDAERSLPNQVLNTSLPVNDPNWYWPSTSLSKKLVAVKTLALLEKWMSFIAKQESWTTTTTWSSFAVLQGSFRMGSSNTCFAVVFHGCPLSSTWWEGSWIPVSIHQPFCSGWQEGLHLRQFPHVNIHEPGLGTGASLPVSVCEWLQTSQVEFVRSGQASRRQCR